MVLVFPQKYDLEHSNREHPKCVNLFFCSDGSLARFLDIREQDLSAGRYAQLASPPGYGVSATSLRDATRTTKLSTSQSNAARTTPGFKMDEV